MEDIESIPDIPDQQARLDAVLVDTYGQDEELSAFEVYLSDALIFPFAAEWRDPDEPNHAEKVKVLGVASVDDRRGILLEVERGRGDARKNRRIVAEQLWATQRPGRNATILDDYRYWVTERYGLDPGFDM